MKRLMNIDDFRDECGFACYGDDGYGCSHRDNDYCTAGSCPLSRLMEVEDEEEFYPQEYKEFKRLLYTDDQIRTIIQDRDEVIVDKD